MYHIKRDEIAQHSLRALSGRNARFVATTNVARASCSTFVDASVFVVTNDVDGITLILSIRPPDGRREKVVDRIRTRYYRERERER